MNNVLLLECLGPGNVGTHMNMASHGVDGGLQALFCLQFQRLLRDLTQRGYPLAEGFGPAWEAAMEDVPLGEAVQGPVYRQMIAWASTQLLFSTPRAPVSSSRSDPLN